jgi:hypothetical protein
MSQALQKFTTEFLPEEDRLRLSGELENGQPVVLWLTQRLLRRLMPHLCAWLEKQPVPGMSGAQVPAMAVEREQVQHIAQQAAQGALQAHQQAPVQAPLDAFNGLVQIVTLETVGARLHLVLRVEQEPAAEFSVSFAPMGLRQWLGIVYRHYETAQWPLEIWPQWMALRATPGHDQPVPAVLH